MSVPSLFYFQCSKILRLFSLTIWSLPSLVASPDGNIAAIGNLFYIMLKCNYRWTRCSEFLFILVWQNISDSFWVWFFFSLAILCASLQIPGKLGSFSHSLGCFVCSVCPVKKKIYLNGHMRTPWKAMGEILTEVGSDNLPQSVWKLLKSALCWIGKEPEQRFSCTTLYVT